YGDARQVAALLNDIFLGNSSAPLDLPTNQLIPGGGAVVSSSDRLSAGAPQSNAPQLPGAPGSAQSSPPGASAGANSRFADASGGRFAQNFSPPPFGRG